MLFSNQPWTEKSVNQSYCYLVYAAPLDNIQKRHFIHIVGSSSPIDVLLGSFTAGCSFYDNCIVHHIQFCPVNLLLISRRAFGSLDTNSGGTAVVSLEGVLTGRERRLPFILRWNVWEPSGQVLALSTDVTAKDSFGLLLRSFRGCRSVSFPLAFLFLLTNCFILLFSRREYNSMRYSENLFPAIALTSSSTWPHAHDRQDSVITALHAKHCWRTMLNSWLTPV